MGFKISEKRFDRMVIAAAIFSMFIFLWTVLSVSLGRWAEISFCGIKIRTRSVNFAMLLTSISCFLWLGRKKLSQVSLKWAWGLSLTFATAISILKVFQFENYVSTGYDFGIRANILYNIFEHGEVWDSLNWTHGFSGHFWPFAYPLSLVYHIWLSPKILLILQSVAIASTIPITMFILSKKQFERTTAWLIIWLWTVNYYLHRMSAFDFHPEVIATPLFLLALYWLDVKKLWLALLALAISLTLKEDVAVGIASIGLYFAVFDSKRRKLGLWMMFLSGVYFVFSVIEILRYGKLHQAVVENYATGKLISLDKLEVPIRYFATFGFIPFFAPKMLLMLALPFFEHLLNTRPPHYRLHGQYVALLLPISLYITIEVVRKMKAKSANRLLLLGILTSSLMFPHKSYLPLNRTVGEKKRYLDRLMESIPKDMPVAAGNHTTPHLALRRFTYQFPTLRDANLIIIDTSWHDYTPMRLKEGERFVDRLTNSKDWKIVSDSFGILVIEKQEEDVETEANR